jgi:putative membrane protein
MVGHAPAARRQVQPMRHDEETTMMNWYGTGMSGWGYGLMTVSMLLFWGLVIAGIVILVRYVGSNTRQTSNTQPGQSSPERILAERFARGDIDNDEYRRRMDTIRGHATL